MSKWNWILGAALAACAWMPAVRAAGADSCRQDRDYPSSSSCQCPKGTQRTSTRGGFRCSATSSSNPGRARTESLSGNLTQQQADSTVAAASDRFVGCLRGSNQANVNVSALIASNGQVVKASASRSSPDDARMRDCVVAQFKTLTFPGTGSSYDTSFVFELALTNPGRVGAGRRGGQRQGPAVHARLQ
jgi:hypothetical protein